MSQADGNLPNPKLPVWDAQLSNNAAAVDQCLKLGAVILQLPKKPTGFGGRNEPS